MNNLVLEETGMENFLTAAKLHTHAKRFMDAYSAAMQPLSREFANSADGGGDSAVSGQ